MVSKRVRDVGRVEWDIKEDREVEDTIMRQIPSGPRLQAFHHSVFTCEPEKGNVLRFQQNNFLLTDNANFAMQKVRWKGAQ